MVDEGGLQARQLLRVGRFVEQPKLPAWPEQVCDELQLAVRWSDPEQVDVDDKYLVVLAEHGRVDVVQRGGDELRLARGDCLGVAGGGCGDGGRVTKTANPIG